MLRSFFIILLYQLVGETIQKFFNIIIPGPVIGLVLLLITFIFIKKFKDKNYIDSCLKNNINFLNGFEKMKKLNDEYLPKYIKENLEKYKKWMI